MADRFPLIANSSANQIQELAASDQLNLTGSNLIFGDSSDGSSDDVLSFGASGDLKIFHQADQSRIVESGPSVLKIMGSDVRISNAGNTADYFQGNDGSDVKLFHNGNLKFATTSGGVDVTGTITMDAVPGTNTNAALPVLFQTSAGVIDGGSQLTYNPGGDVLVVNGLTLSTSQVRTSGNTALQLTTANANGTVDLYVRTTHVECNGNFLPQTNNTDNLGSISYRWANVYVNDLQLSNEAKKDTGGNDVDGTWGDWTLQEGEDKVYMINNRSGKKYSLKMEEE